MLAFARTNTSSRCAQFSSLLLPMIGQPIIPTHIRRKESIPYMHLINSDPFITKISHSNYIVKSYNDVMMRREFSNMIGKTLGWDWKKRAAVQRMADHKKEETERSRRIQFEVDTFRNKKHLEIHSITDKLSIKLIFPSMNVYNRVKDALTSTFHVEKVYQPHSHLNHHSSESEEQSITTSEENVIDNEEQVIQVIQDRPNPTLSQIPPVLYFSYFDYDEILKFFTENFDDILLEPIPNFVFEVLDHYDMMVKAFKTRQKRNKSEYDLSLRLPAKMFSSILPFQKEGIEFGISRDGRVMLCDEMGLGKTLQALGIACYYTKDWPMLIVGPCSLHNNWKKELTTWIDMDWVKKTVGDTFNIQGDSLEQYIAIVDSTQNLMKLIDETSVQPKKYLAFIISYDLISKNSTNDTKISEWLSKFSLIIGDESHMIKNDDSKRAKNILPLLKTSKRVILISGTASPSRPIELFTQMKALLSSQKGKATLLKKTQFGERYCDLKSTYFTGADYRGSKRLSELHVLLSRSVMIRRLKRDVLSQLPPKRRFLTYLNLPEEDIGPHRLTFESFRKRKKGSILDPNDSEVLQKYNLTAVAKQRSIGLFARKYLRKGEKFLIFAHHRSVMNTIEEHIRDEIQDIKVREGKTYKFVRIDGETPIDQRQDISQQFREDPDVKVAILSIAVAGVGLNFVPCKTVVFGELTWNSGSLVQCEDRAHRIGQKSTVDIHYLIARNTLDEYIWELLSHKIDVVSETLNGEKELENEHHITRGSKEIIDI
ncbi:hypothetical protein C9374_001677 [Naegleria lovaniensis]|uniref:Uncharacterized protein n=1 Tax=Naegleria lovaniensis TaxID=51637 RepID=A0AA88GUV7_NAELO|nr:uncharacterized protein C9374_001677 [Naegleria lovaniensis]KAG2387345.1 hypothetical protein C9374_001677 [Naegleria lovaniensis]